MESESENIYFLGPLVFNISTAWISPEKNIVESKLKTEQEIWEEECKKNRQTVNEENIAPSVIENIAETKEPESKTQEAKQVKAKKEELKKKEPISQQDTKHA